MIELDNLLKLYNEHKLKEKVYLWGIGKKTGDLIEQWCEKLPSVTISGIIDNYKYVFMDDYKGIKVLSPDTLNGCEDKVTVLLAVATFDSIWKQANAMGIESVYYLTDLEVDNGISRCDFPYTFIDRSKGYETVCYVLAGYQHELWDTTLARMFNFMEDGVDYCMISSGKHDEQLDELCEQYGWSYLYCTHNQICYLQNQVVIKHPKARFFIKLDEDMFIGESFIRDMISGYKIADAKGDYRVGCVAPVMPLNYNSYVSYLDAIGRRDEFEKLFGRTYRSIFSAPYGVQKAAIWLWDTVTSIDESVKFFHGKEAEPRPLCSLYNIGAFLYTRERWILMGMWPENPKSSGMGEDEAYLFEQNMNSGMATYELQNVFVGHFAFSGQKEMMFEYYKKHHEKFEIK